MKYNTKMYQPDKYGHNKPRAWFRKSTKKLSQYCIIKCGCCQEKVVIYFDDHKTTNECANTLEIGGVIASRTEWLKILKPILGL